MTTYLIQGASILGAEPTDLLLRDGAIAAIAPAGTLPSSTEAIDADGRFVAPGFWDAHVHFTQWVVRRQRVDLAPAASAAEAVAIMRAALPVREDAVLIGYGFRDGLWTDAPTRAALDAVPHARDWARRFGLLGHGNEERFVKRSAPVIMHSSVAGIAAAAKARRRERKGERRSRGSVQEKSKFKSKAGPKPRGKPGQKPKPRPKPRPKRP